MDKKDVVTGTIITESVEVIRDFGRGLSPKVFARLLEIRLVKNSDFKVLRNHIISPKYLGETIGELKIDLIVNDVVLYFITDSDLDRGVQVLKSKLMFIKKNVGLVIDISSAEKLKDSLRRVMIR